MTSGSARLARRLLISALVLWTGAALAYGSLRLVYGSRPADINVRWSASVDDAQRALLERRFSLTAGVAREGTTWTYSLTDVSRANVRALVQDPLVEDTHQINRIRFTIWPEATRGPYVGAENSRMPSLLEGLSTILLVLGVFPAALALMERVPVPAALRTQFRPASMAFTEPIATVSGVTGWIERQIPPVTPEAVALFRIVFGVGLVAIVSWQPVSSAFLATDGASNQVTAVQREALGLLRAAPAAADWLTTWVVAWGALFIAGALARVSFAMLAAGVLVWAALLVTQTGAHSISALMLTLLCLLPSRWADAWSVDAWLRRGRDPGTPRAADAIYGYTVWMPGVVLGVTFFAAAIAKLRESGLDWILNGTVKYHFLTHAQDALVDWGAWIGTHSWFAVLLSFGAIAIEAGVIVGALSRAYRYRAIAGLAALAILAGFALLQGLFWPAWWLLLLSFLPWHRIQASPAAASAAPTARPLLRTIQLALVVLLAAEQLVVSALRIELNPVFSEYDMYSISYASPEEYEFNAGMSYRLVAHRDDNSTSACEIDKADADALSDAPDDTARSALIARVLDGCVGRARIDSVSVEGRRMAIDWTRWRQAGEVSVPLAGPIPMSRNQP